MSVRFLNGSRSMSDKVCAVGNLRLCTVVVGLCVFVVFIMFYLLYCSICIMAFMVVCIYLFSVVRPRQISCIVGQLSLSLILNYMAQYPTTLSTRLWSTSISQTTLGRWSDVGSFKLLFSTAMFTTMWQDAQSPPSWSSCKWTFLSQHQQRRTGDLWWLLAGLMYLCSCFLLIPLNRNEEDGTTLMMVDTIKWRTIK